MAEIPKWQYDEMQQAGVDYADASVVAQYDENHRRFRDYKKSAEDIISVLGLRPEHTVIDIGCGTGAFVLHAAPRCKKIYAVDVSAAMLEYLKEKAEKDNLKNIEYHQAGFLTYEHTDEPVDVVVSVAALHHLPDFWKLVGLSRIADMLKPGGSLCLFDVVYSCSAREHKAAFDQWVSSTEASLGKEFADETVIHIRDEYSTCGWILEGMLERSGFTIQEKRTLKTMPGTTYICLRNGL
jgi:putative AdoMet-dependent methyltransferase